MINYTDCVIDLETIGNAPHRQIVILSIGAVLFNPGDEDTMADLVDDRCLYYRLDLEDQQRQGLQIDSSAIEWWMQQGTMARQVFKEPVVSPAQFILDFNKFLVDYGVEYLWGNGNTFDNMILRNFYAAYNMVLPIHWARDMDMRTLKRRAGGYRPYIDRGTEHNALEDAKYETLCIQDYWRMTHRSEPRSRRIG